MFQTIVEAVLDHAANRGTKKALIMKKEAITYAGLGKLVRKSAQILSSEYHVRAGDKVMIAGLSKPDYIVIFLGIQYLHAVTVPLDKVWHEDTLRNMAALIRPVLIISNKAVRQTDVRQVTLKDLYREIAGAGITDDSDGVDGGFAEYRLPDMDSVAEMLFTTGTTGAPKGVMLTCGNILSITKNNIEGVGFREDDIVLDALPLCHSLGLREARMALYAGGTLVIQNGFNFRKELCAALRENQCTGFVCIPAAMEALTRTLPDFADVFGRLRYIEIGAGSLSYGMKKRLPAMLPDTDIFNTWGSSETGGVIFLDVRRRPDKSASLGKPVSSARIGIIGRDGRQISARDIDHAGRLAIRGEMTMAGYYEMPELNRETLVDGWLCTNDLAYTDDEGFVYMAGRADDIINVGGEKVSPVEVENAATEYGPVRDAACIGVDDPEGIMGQVPVLYVVTDDADSFSGDRLMRFLAQRLEIYKLPKQILRVGEIPRNRMEKLDRKAVRKLWEEHS